MRILFIILISLVFSISLFSQPISNRSSDVITVQDGNLFAKNSFRPAPFADTLSANNSVTTLDSCGKLIFTYSDNSYWLRACSPKRWVRLLKEGEAENISNAALTADGNYAQNWNNKQLRIDSIAGSLFFRGGGIGNTGTVRKEFSISWPGSAFANQLDAYSILTAIRKSDNSADSLRLGLLSGGTGVLSMGSYDVANSANNTFISYSSTAGLININAKDSIWIKGAVPAATADSILAVVYRSSPGISKIVKIPLTATGLNNTNLGSDFRWLNEGTQEVKTVANSNTIAWDSTSTANSLTAKADTSVLATQYDLTQISASPGGSNTQVQFNDAGAFGGDAGFTFNKTTNTVTTDSLRLLNARINEDPYVADSIRYHGTSITVGTGQSSGNRYSTLTSNKLNSIESNKGISGAYLVVQGVANIPTLPIYSRSLYRWIILEWGVNDINSATTASAFGAAYRPYIDTLIIARGWPADRIVILAPSYIDPVEYPTATLAKQQDFRDTTEAIASDKGTKWVDIYSPELFRNPDLILADGLHPNDYGASIYVNAICNAIGDSVMSTNQNLSINGITEFQRLKLRTVDTANYKSVVTGFDSAGVVVRYTKDQILQNSETLPTAQAASIDLIGRGYFGNVTSPTAVEVVQANGMIKGTSLRATGSSPVGLTGAGMELAYIGGKGFLLAYDRDGSTGQQLAMNSLGGAVTIGTSATPNGTELLYAPVASKFKSGQFNGTIQAGLKDSAVEVGLLSSTIGYIGAYNRTVGSNMRLSINALGGNVMVGGFTDDAIGALQVKGKLTVTSHDIAADSDSALVRVHATGEYEYAKINGGITTLNTLTAATQTFAVGTANTDFNIVSSGSTHTFNIPDASASNRGLVTTGTQTIAGAKTFNDNITFGTTNSIVGTVTNNDAVAGNIGEEFNSTVSTYTNYSTTATYQNITSITLTAGDWDLSAFFTYSSNSATITAAANAIFVVSTTTASAAGATEGVNIAYVPQAALLGTSLFSEAIAPYRVSISGTTTYYLNTQATFTLGNPQFVGTIRARRVR